MTAQGSCFAPLSKRIYRSLVLFFFVSFGAFGSLPNKLIAESGGAKRIRNTKNEAWLELRIPPVENSSKRPLLNFVEGVEQSPIFVLAESSFSELRRSATVIRTTLPRSHELVPKSPNTFTRLVSTKENESASVRVWDVQVPIDSSEYCATLEARARRGFRARSQTIELCVAAKTLAKRVTGMDLGAFYFRRSWAWWLQAGSGLSSTAFSTPERNTSLFSEFFLPFRAGTGLAFQNIEVEAHIRRALVDFSGASYQPQWIQFYGSYGFEFEELGNLVTPYLQVLAGYDRYSNQSTSSTTRYVASYARPSFGIRSRWVIGNRFETGGEILYTLPSNGYKFFIQGDLRYWFDRDAAIGAGYWLDLLRYKGPSGSFSENIGTLELQLRYVL